MRVAAIDLGTNTTRLLVADVHEGRVDEVVRREEITRLGEGVDRRRILLPTAVARVRNVLVEYRREAERLGAERLLAVGTSAVRDAENGEAFLGEVEWSYAFATRLLDGREEARLTMRGVAVGRQLAPGTLLVDVGGGSTELVVAADCGEAQAFSLEAGSVRLTERFLRADPPAAAELAGCAAHVRSLLPDVHAVDAIGVAGTVVTAAAVDAIGVAGTVVTAAAIELGGAGPVDGHRLHRASVAETIDRLATLPLAERAGVPGVAAGRAPVIVAGLVVLREVLDRYGLETIAVSVRDLLDGVALEAAELPDPDEGPVPPSAFTCC